MSRRTSLIIAGALLVVAILIIINLPSSSQHLSKPSSQETTNTPQYQTVLPSGKSIKDLGGWKKLTPPKGSPFYTYVDSINDVPVNVSQQQLPKAFQSNTNEKVAELAKGYNATSKLTVNGLTVYIGRSAKGPQSVIFTQDNLLVFIKSERKIANSSWKQYIASLGIPSSTDTATY